MLRSTVLLAAILGLAGCPGDDTTEDSGNDTGMTSVADTADTDPGTTTAPEGTTTTEGEQESSDGMADATSTGELVLGDIEVTVIYEGEQTGTLNVVAITEFPPMGPPLAVASDMEPAFPWTGTLMGLEAGEYIIFATLDVGNDNPTIPGPEDPQAAAEMPVVVDGAGPFTVEITLMDPA